VAVAAVYVGLTLVYCRTLLPVIGSALPNDIGDPGLNAWILWWNSQALPLTERWWNGPIFYPVKGALALSETFLNLWPLSSPMQWAGASPTLTYNVMFLLSFPAAALAAHALAYRLTGRHDAGFVAGLAFGFAPYRAAQVPHLQTLWSCWMPLGLLALHRYLDRLRQGSGASGAFSPERLRDLALFGLCWIMNGLSTGYYLFFFAVLVGLWLLWFGRSVAQWTSIALAAGIASLALAPLLIGYQRYQSALGLTRSGSEIEHYSADLSAVWAADPDLLPSMWTFEPRSEGELYPGAAAMLLIVCGVVGLWRRGNGPPEGGHYVRRSVFLFYVFAAVCMLLFALGPNARLFDTTFWSHAPYYWLTQLPGGHAFRVPARFAMLLALCVATGAALALSRLTRAPRVALALPICAAIALEGMVFKMAIAPVPPASGTGGVPRGAVLLELPVGDTFAETPAMLRATRTGVTLVNGFSGYLPKDYLTLREGFAHHDASVLDVLQQSGSLFVLVREEDDPEHRYRTMVADRAGTRRVLANSTGTLFQLPGRPAEQTSAPGSLVPITSVSASLANDFTKNMLDANPVTRWLTTRPQRVGDEVSVTLDRAVTVSRVELDLGEFANDFPRGLRITVAGNGQAPQVVWDQGTAGPAMLAARRDPVRMPLVLDLPRRATGDRLVMTLTDEDEGYYWSIVELRVFGK
jgi:hypothetical protein